jgi:glycosyltransferase involved in cell wall biosynthesis
MPSSQNNSRKYDIGFFSSADRGLDTLLNIMPEVEKRLGRPVTSVWAYGWNTFDLFHAKNPGQMKWKFQVIREMNKVGMESKGRLTHVELAKLMKDTNVWAYPTDFPEIHCITALKAQAAGCKVVTSGYAALQETVKQDEPDINGISGNPDELENFIQRLVEALKTPRDEKQLELTADWAKSHNWAATAAVWDKHLL